MKEGRGRREWGTIDSGKERITLKVRSREETAYFRARQQMGLKIIWISFFLPFPSNPTKIESVRCLWRAGQHIKQALSTAGSSERSILPGWDKSARCALTKLVLVVWECLCIWPAPLPDTSSFTCSLASLHFLVAVDAVLAVLWSLQNTKYAKGRCFGCPSPFQGLLETCCEVQLKLRFLT